MVEEIIKDIFLCTHENVELSPFTFTMGNFEHGTQLLFRLLQLIFPDVEYLELVMTVSNMCRKSTGISSNVLSEKDVIKYINLKK